jgi:transposase, IS5 family
MIRKSNKPFTFADAAFIHTENKWNNHWLNRILKLVNWKPFEKQLERLYSPDEGRPGWNPICLFRCLLLAEWNGLSDRQLEEALDFRFDFKKFAGLELDEEAPDSTTFVVFRKRIQGLYKNLLDMLNWQLEKAGFEIKKAIAIDATLVESHSKPRKDGSGDGDPDGSWRGFPTKKTVDDEGKEIISRRMALHGYKVNLAASVGTGFIGGLSICKASEHETHHFKEFISSKTEEVYADKGYAGQRSYLDEKGDIENGIQYKASRGHPLYSWQKQRNKYITRHRRIVEGVFGSLKQWYGWRKTRFMGLLRNQLAIHLTAIAWNMKKWAMAT